MHQAGVIRPLAVFAKFEGCLQEVDVAIIVIEWCAYDSNVTVCVLIVCVQFEGRLQEVDVAIIVT